MKKPVIVIALIVVFIVIIAFVATPVVKLMQVYYNYQWKYAADYKEYANEFNLLKDYVQEVYPNASRVKLSDSYSSEFGRRLYELNSGKYLTLPDNVQSALNTVSKYGFPEDDSPFDLIAIDEDRVSFHIENFRYALVFSPNGKPTWINSPGEDERIKVRKIQDGWYDVIIDPG